MGLSSSWSAKKTRWVSLNKTGLCEKVLVQADPIEQNWLRKRLCPGGLYNTGLHHLDLPLAKQVYMIINEWLVVMVQFSNC